MARGLGIRQKEIIELLKPTQKLGWVGQLAYGMTYVELAVKIYKVQASEITRNQMRAIYSAIKALEKYDIVTLIDRRTLEGEKIWCLNEKARSMRLERALHPPRKQRPPRPTLVR